MFEIQDISPPPRSLGIHALPPVSRLGVGPEQLAGPLVLSCGQASGWQRESGAQLADPTGAVPCRTCRRQGSAASCGCFVPFMLHLLRFRPSGCPFQHRAAPAAGTATDPPAAALCTQSTHNGDLIEVEGSAYVVQSVVLQYKLVRGRYK